MAFKTGVYRYSSIAEILARLPQAYQANIHNPRQRIQLEEIDRILKRNNVTTAVGEEYLDRHFIHDFCGHYGSCYHDYPKKCIRLNFFTKRFFSFTMTQYAANQPLSQASQQSSPEIVRSMMELYRKGSSAGHTLLDEKIILSGI